jgi:hypothetical protein
MLIHNLYARGPSAYTQLGMKDHLDKMRLASNEVVWQQEIDAMIDVIKRRENKC